MTAGDSPLPARQRTPLPGVSSRTWEHPSDRAALAAVRRVPGADRLLRALAGLVREPSARLLAKASHVQVSERQFARVHAIHADACRVLDLAERPDLFVAQGPVVQARAVGVDRPFLVLSSAAVDLFDDDELRFVVGHELGHVLSGHAVYGTMLLRLTELSRRTAFVPLGSLGLRAVVVALESWQRAAELSGDRAGLLAGQDPAAAQRALMKTAGGRLEEMDAVTFLEQGREYRASPDLRDGVLTLLSLQGQTHPFTAVRAVELAAWVEEGDYRRALGGEYLRRADDADASVREEWRHGVGAARRRLVESDDALTAFLRDTGGDVAAAGAGLLADLGRRVREAGAARDTSSSGAAGGDAAPPSSTD